MSGKFDEVVEYILSLSDDEFKRLSEEAEKEWGDTLKPFIKFKMTEAQKDDYDPYCKICGHCGETGCCPIEKCTKEEGCLYPYMVNEDENS